MLKILLVEDHHVVSNGLKMILESNENFKIAAEAINGYDGLEVLAAKKNIDIVLSDINMPEMDGIMMTKAIREQALPVKIVLLSMNDDETFYHEAFRAGADGYLLKSASIEELTFALNHVHSGDQYLSSSLCIKQALKHSAKGGSDTAVDMNLDLSSRELEVLQLLANGATNLEMADQLYLSKRTVEGHRQSLIKKFSAKNTAELISLSMRSGLIV